jgi:hypothetical protein
MIGGQLGWGQSLVLSSKLLVNNPERLQQVRDGASTCVVHEFLVTFIFCVQSYFRVQLFDNSGTVQLP